MFRTRWSERRRARPSAAPESEHPRLRDSVALVAPSARTGTAWLVTADDVPVARVPGATAEAMRLLDGSRSLPEIRVLLTADADELDALVARLRSTGLLDGTRVRGGRGVIRVIPPLTLQIASSCAAPAFAHVADMLRPILRSPAGRRAFLVLLAVLLLAGVAAGLVLAPAIADLLARPLELTSLAAVGLALLFATALHELAHGVVLHLAGGTARRAGFMVFYLSPAFFVDVTDSWRLASRHRRAAVALAGPAVHAAAASAAVLVALGLPVGPVRDAVLGFGLAAAGVSLFNLLPFVRFDGYFALVAATDTPRLRQRALDALDALVVGAAGDRRPWLLVLGLGSLVVPVVLVLAALERLTRAASSTGPAGSALVLALGILLIVIAVRRCGRWIARPDGRRRRRVALLAGAVLVGLLAGVLIRVPSVVSVGFVRAPEGAWLVSSDPAALSALATGSEVRLETRGLVRHDEVGRGVVGAPGGTGPVAAPLESLAPVRAGDALVPVSSRRLLLAGGAAPPPTGAAVVRTGGDRPLLIAALLDPIRALVPVDVLLGGGDASADPPHTPHRESREMP